MIPASSIRPVTAELQAICLNIERTSKIVKGFGATRAHKAGCWKSSTKDAILGSAASEVGHEAAIIDLRNICRLALLVLISDVQRTARDFDLSNLGSTVSSLPVRGQVIAVSLHEARDALANLRARLASIANFDQTTSIALRLEFWRKSLRFRDFIAPAATGQTVQPLRSATRAGIDPSCSIRNGGGHRTSYSFVSGILSTEKLLDHNQHSSTILPWSTSVGPATSAIGRCPGGDPLVGNDVGPAPFAFMLRAGEAERTFLAQDSHTARWRPCRDQRDADRRKSHHDAVAIK